MSKKVVFAAMPIGNNDHIAIEFKNYLSKTDIAIVETKNIFIKFCNYNNINIDNIYEYNNSNILQIILDGIKNNKNILIVSNDGYPNIQDFGSSLIQLLIQKNIEIDLIPGPSSVLQSLFFSSFEGDGGQFYFGGRIPYINTIDFLQSISNISCPIILICIPFLDKYLYDISNIFPSRDIAICIDLSKPTQKIIRGKTTEALELIKRYRLFPFNFDIINGAKTSIHSFYSYYTLVISQIK